VVAVLGVLGMLLVVWGAAAPRGGPSDSAGRGPADWARVDSENFIFRTGCGWLCLPGPPGGAGVTTSDTIAAVLGRAVAGLLVAVAALLVLALLRFWWVTGEGRSIAVDAAPVLDLAALSVAVAADAPERAAALSSGTPAQGVIAAWTRLEGTLLEAGVPLPASRTSSETTFDVLRHFSVDPATLNTLADLYREARWSRHALTEKDRARAVEAYAALVTAINRRN
jgi:hypothetical protein